MAMRNYLFGLILLAYAGTLFAHQDSDFLAARQAFQSGDAKRLEEYAQRLQDHPLRPYVDYFQFRMVLNTIDMASVRDFLARHDGNLVTDRLRGDWLKLLGKNQQWHLFETEYPLLVNKDNELTCYSLQQRLHRQDKEALTEARSMWFT
ncbi:MAG: transglycosylase, partial [Nitrosomonas sp.]|nr:transglycosylase [Nitrosomonas sp.]